MTPYREAQLLASSYVHSWRTLPWKDRRGFVAGLEKSAKESVRIEDKKAAQLALQSINHLRGMVGA